MGKISRHRLISTVSIWMMLILFFGLGFGFSRGYYRDSLLALQIIPVLKFKYLEPLSATRLFLSYLQKGNVPELLKSLGDPYTKYLNEKEYVLLLEENKGSYGGVGIYLEYKNEELIIFKPMKNSPADRAGLIPGDRIIAIDHQPTTEMSKEIAITKILGPPGSAVLLTIKRGPDINPVVKNITLTRTIIDPSIEWEIKIDPVAGKIGWINLTQFSEKTAQDLAKALQAFSREKVFGIILDLRYNPGGLLISAVEVASQLIQNGSDLPIVSLKYQNQKEETFVAYPNPHRSLPPLVLLVNEWSASSSEIVAGAVKDLKAGILVGNTTFGKGLVQDVIPLPTGGALYLTVATYLTSGGNYIHKKGIPPDVIVSDENKSTSDKIDFNLQQKIDLQQEEVAIQVLRKLIHSTRKPAA